MTSRSDVDTGVPVVRGWTWSFNGLRDKFSNSSAESFE